MVSLAGRLAVTAHVYVNVVSAVNQGSCTVYISSSRPLSFPFFFLPPSTYRTDNFLKLLQAAVPVPSGASRFP